MDSATQSEVEPLRLRVSCAVLVIDDDQSFRALLRTLLTRAGYDVYEAGNGIEGLRIAAGTALDLMITDLIMPEQEGIETIRSVRNLSPQLKILAVSGVWACHGYLALAKRLGANATLEKALVPKFLLATIGALIKTP